MLPLSNIRAFVDSRLKKLSINCIVGQRLKRMPSIIGKITRFPGGANEQEEQRVPLLRRNGGVREWSYEKAGYDSMPSQKNKEALPNLKNSCGA